MAASPLLLSSSRKPCLNAARSSPASAHARPPGVRGAGLRRERFYSCTAILPQSHANATHKNNTSVGAEAATAEAASFQHFCPWYCNTPEGGCKADPRRPAAPPCCPASPQRQPFRENAVTPQEGMGGRDVKQQGDLEGHRECSEQGPDTVLVIPLGRSPRWVDARALTRSAC